MRIRAAITLATVLAASCSYPRVVADIDRESPPQDLGRPGYVRYTARTGAWLGGLVGAVASVVTLPVTWPISLVSDEPLGYAKQEFLYWGVSAGAGGGHFLLGAPVDSLDWIFRRAWTESEFEPGFDYTPAKRPPVPPKDGE